MTISSRIALREVRLHHDACGRRFHLELLFVRSDFIILLAGNDIFRIALREVHLHHLYHHRFTIIIIVVIIINIIVIITIIIILRRLG